MSVFAVAAARCAAKEQDRRCQQLIVDNHLWSCRVTGQRSPLPCIFANVEACVPPNTFDSDMSFMWKLHRISTADCQRYQMCSTHNRMCDQFPVVSADVDISGLPCPDYSMCGSRKCEHGGTNSVFICHAKRQVQLATPLLIIENVQARLTTRSCGFLGSCHAKLQVSVCNSFCRA